MVGCSPANGEGRDGGVQFGCSLLARTKSFLLEAEKKKKKMPNSTNGFVTSIDDVHPGCRAVPYVMLTTVYGFGEEKRLILPMHACDGSGYLRNHMQGLRGLPGSESALLGRRRRSSLLHTSASPGDAPVNGLSTTPVEGASAAGGLATANSMMQAPVEHGGIRNHWGVHQATEASQAYKKFVQKHEHLLRGGGGDWDSDKEEEGSGGTDSSSKSPVWAADGAERVMEVSHTLRVDSVTNAGAVSESSACSSVVSVSEDYFNELQEAEVLHGQTSPSTTQYAPASLPGFPPPFAPSPFVSAKSSTGSEGEAPFVAGANAAEDNYQCWTSNTIHAMPILPFPGIPSRTLLELADYLARRASLGPDDCTDLMVAQGLPDPSGAGDLVTTGLERMLAAAFLQM